MAETTDPASLSLIKRQADSRTSPVVCVSLFLFAVVLFSILIGRFSPPPEYFRKKLRLFSQNKDDVDLVFFGASDTHWGISPDVFDERLRLRGINLNSFNLGVPGSNGYEINHMIRTVLEMKPARLRYVVIAWRPWRLERDASRTRREIWWHAFPDTLILLRGLWLDPISAREKFEHARVHGKLALQNFLHLGLGGDLVRLYTKLPASDGGEGIQIAGQAGFEALSLDDPDRYWPEGPEERRVFLENLDQYHASNEAQAAMIREFKDHDRQAVPDYLATLYPRTVYSTTLQVEQLRAHGVEPIYLIPPSHAHDRIQRRLAVEGYIPVLLDFNNPDRYPELFDVELRYDDEHFIEQGAELYTRLLADQVADILKAKSSTELAPAH